MPKPTTETISLWQLGDWLKANNLVIRPVSLDEPVKWIVNKKTQLKEPHVWTREANGQRDAQTD